MRDGIKREVLKLKESINFYLDFYLKHLHEGDVTEQLEFGVDTMKDVKQITNGHQRFLKDLLKLQSKKKYRIVKENE